MYSDEEFLDLVDEKDNVIDKMPMTEVYEKKLHNFRMVYAFIRNKEGKLWIPRRTVYKKRLPLYFNPSMGGHVTSGESYEEGFHRELLEELNMDSNKLTYRLIKYLTPTDSSIYAYTKVYEIESDEVPNYNTEDFIEYNWLKPKEALILMCKENREDCDLNVLLKEIYLKQ